jgi:NADPH2:quinone reductase
VSDAASYRAVVCETLGRIEGRPSDGPRDDGLGLRTLPRPPLPPDSVRVAIKAAGVNFPDLLMVAGLYQHRPALPFVPGLEAAGIVSEVASGVANVTVGERVIVRMRSGAYAEQAVVAPDALSPMPAAFSFAEAATFLVAHLTAYHALKTRAALRSGETLIVLGAAGGVGLAAVEIGKLLGARVIAVASSPEKRRAASAMGADHAIAYREAPLGEAVQRLTGGAGADVVFDPVGQSPEVALGALAWQGRLLIVGFAAGAIPRHAANRVLIKGATLMGVRAGEAGRRDPALRRQELAALGALATHGLVKPLVSATYPLKDFAAAMRELAERRAIGRIALSTER